MNRVPKCRFAPSPTGYLHVGSAQSALFNWLFARSTGAEFLLRIEDTDAERNRPELTDNILDMLGWLGIEWEGKPVQGYDGHCRDRDLGPGPDRALRFKRPLDAMVTWPDVVRGPMRIAAAA